MAHQAVTADGVQDGSMEVDTVPGKPPGDASCSAGLSRAASPGRQGSQAGLPHQAGTGAVIRNDHMYSSEGLAAPPSVFCFAVSCFACISLNCLWILLCQFA